MSMVKHQFIISSRQVAQWLDSQPGTWWLADGDPLLTSRICFPCPSDELAEELRRIDQNIIVYTNKAVGMEDGRQIDSHVLPRLADTANRHHERNFLARWQSSDVEWLLSEDKSAAEAFTDVSLER
ncbi:MAG: hypothetical protein ACHRXM_02630 [Isosphaerales bacterium]